MTLCFSYTEKDFKMDSRYRQYSSNVSNYLKNRPRELVNHCLIKLSMAKAIRNNSITIQSTLDKWNLHGTEKNGSTY